jgi:hypothetical protein
MVNLSDSRINTTGSFFGRPLSTFVCSLNEGRFQFPFDQHFQILSMLFLSTPTQIFLRMASVSLKFAASPEKRGGGFGPLQKFNLWVLCLFLALHKLAYFVIFISCLFWILFVCTALPRVHDCYWSWIFFSAHVCCCACLSKFIL